MVLNVFEESSIKNSKLPIEWQSQTSLDELADFLQTNWEQRSAFYEDGQVTSRQQFLSFIGQRGIRTNNYIGTIVFKGQQLNIFPKMFKTDKYDYDTSDLDLKDMFHNLVKWLEYCTKMEYPYISISSDLTDSSDLRDLFITLYVRYVKAAIDHGLFYRYVEQTEDCTSIKGKIDISDYFIRKIPSGQLDRFRCSFSNFEFDNALNRIIKFTCKELFNESSKTNQKVIRAILTRLNEVSDVKCSPHDCDTIRLSRLHRQYMVILSMSKMFLLNKTASYNIDNTESFCFLFPTELLFEGFIGGFIKTALQGKARTTLQASDTSLIDDVIINETSYGAAFTLRNDIYVQMKNGCCFVLDTKYKALDRIENTADSAAAIKKQISIDDLRQIREYAYKRNLKEGYLLYPIFRYEDLDQPQKVTLKGSITVNDEKHSIDVHVLRIPFIFEVDEEETVRRLFSCINTIFKSD